MRKKKSQKMLNASKTLFKCEWTGIETPVRYYIPTDSARGVKKGTFLDANCVVAHLMKSKKRNWRRKVEMVEELAGGRKVEPAPERGWTPTAATRVTNVPGMMQHIDQVKRPTTAPPLAKKRKREVVSSSFPQILKGKAVAAELRREKELALPKLEPLPLATAAAASNHHHYTMTVVDNGVRRVYRTNDWRHVLRDDLHVPVGHAMPAFISQANEFVLYPQLCCDPKHVRASPMSVTVRISTDDNK